MGVWTKIRLILPFVVAIGAFGFAIAAWFEGDTVKALLWVILADVTLISNRLSLVEEVIMDGEESKETVQ